MENNEMEASIDSYFASLDAEMEKSIQIADQADRTADEGLSGLPKSQDDEKREKERPKQISDVPDSDQDGSRAKGYDSIQSKQSESDQPEAKQVKDQSPVMKKSEGQEDEEEESPFTKAEYQEYQALKKAQVEEEEEELRKSDRNDLKDLIKEAVSEARAEDSKTIETLTKSLEGHGDLLKSLSKQPMESKTVTNVEALEKGVRPSEASPESFSKSEILDAATALEKAGEITDLQVMEIEQTGNIYGDIDARRKVERYLAKNS